MNIGVPGISRPRRGFEMPKELFTRLQKKRVRVGPDTLEMLEDSTARGIQASSVAAARMQDSLEDMVSEVDKWRGKKGTVPGPGVLYFRRDPWDLQKVGNEFYRNSRTWMDYVIDHLAIPASKAKAVEMLTRLFNRVKAPKDYVKWFDQNAKRWDLMRKTVKWGLRGDGEEGTFSVGPFTVHNTIGASGKTLERVVRIVEMAAKKAPKGTGLPGFARTIGGNLYIVGKIGRPQWAAWYMEGKDAIYLRPVRGMSEKESAQHLIHELGHRYKRKMMDKKMWDRWVSHHRQMGSKPTSTGFPDVGVRLPLKVNNKDAEVGEYVEGGAKIVEVGSGKEIGTVTKRKLLKWVTDAAAQLAFPSIYASGDAEEHFAEALSMKAMGTLGSDHERAFDAVVSGGSSARVAARYAELKIAPTPGITTYVTDKSNENLPTDIDREQQVTLPLPGSATPGGEGRDIPQFVFNTPDYESNIQPRTLGIPGEQYGDPTKFDYNTPTRRSMTGSENEGEDEEAGQSRSNSYVTDVVSQLVDNDDDDEGMGKEAYKQRWTKGKRQRKSRGRTKQKRKMYNRRNKAKRKMYSKKWRRKNKNNSAFKRSNKRRRSSNRKRRTASASMVAYAYRTAGVLTVPDIAFVIGPDQMLGYVRSISPMSGMVTIELDEPNALPLDSLPVDVFLRMAVFLTDEDIDAFYDLVDVEIGPEAYEDIDEEGVRECARLYDRDPDSSEFQNDCFELTGESELGAMGAHQLESVSQSVITGAMESGHARSLEDAANEDISEEYDPRLYYGEVEVER